MIVSPALWAGGERNARHEILGRRIACVRTDTGRERPKSGVRPAARDRPDEAADGLHPRDRSGLRLPFQGRVEFGGRFLDDSLHALRSRDEIGRRVRRRRQRTASRSAASLQPGTATAALPVPAAERPRFAELLRMPQLDRQRAGRRAWGAVAQAQHRGRLGGKQQQRLHQPFSRPGKPCSSATRRPSSAADTSKPSARR